MKKYRYSCYRIDPDEGFRPVWLGPDDVYAVLTVPEDSKVASASSLEELRLKCEVAGVRPSDVCPRVWAFSCAKNWHETDENYR